MMNHHQPMPASKVQRRRPSLRAMWVLGASALLLAACSKPPQDAAAPAASTAAAKVAPAVAAKEEPPRPVRSMRVSVNALDSAIILPAEVKPRFEQRYGFRVGGKVAKRFVDVGQAVKAGQVLAVMDSADVMPAIAAQNAQVDAARTDAALQQSELKRVQELSEKGFVSSVALDRQVALTQASASRLKAAQSQSLAVGNGLKFQTLRADQAGVVTGIDAEVGSVVSAGQTVVRVSQTGEKELQVSVPERNVAALRTASSIIAIADAVPGKVYTATLRELAPTADPASRTYAARMTIKEADEALRWGMSGTVRVALGDAKGIVVPNSSLYTRDSTARVWVVDRAALTVQPVVVKLGAISDDGVVIVEGLKEGDTVVTAGANLLQPGQKVRLLDGNGIAPVKANAPAASGASKP